MPKEIERKPRGGCLLKNLAPARQQELLEYMEGVGDEKGHTYTECVAWLSAGGVETSKSSLSNWRTWYYQRLQFQWNRETTEILIEDDKMPGEQYSDEDIQRKGNRMFSLMAMATRDDKAWARQQTIALRQKAIAAAERRMEFEITRYEEQRASVKQVEASQELTHEEREKRINQILGTE